MKFNTVYNIILCGILACFFVGSYCIGTILYRAETTPVELPAAAGAEMADVTPEPVETHAPPREVQVCDYTQSVWYYDIPLTDAQQDYVFDTCGRYDVPCELALAIMGASADYQTDKVSDDGDWGIMQINAINHLQLGEELGVTDFLDFKQNVLCGVYMLSEYYHKYTDFGKIAMCYRYGEKGAADMWERGIHETDFTRQVIRCMAYLKYR